MAELLQDREENWINTQMRKLLAEDFCPKCGKHNKLHDNVNCDMRYTPDKEA